MKRLQSTSKTFSIFDKKSKNVTNTEVSNNSNKAAKKSGFSFLSLEASMNDKSLEVYRDQHFVCIRDKYPKSRVHLLLIPLPALTNGTKLLKVEQLVKLPKPFEILTNMKSIAEKIITDTVIKGNKYPQSSDLKIGFHSVQSMAPLHMHIISRDFHSPCLKNKKHWNSFNTDYFIEMDNLMSHLDSSKEYFPEDFFNLKNTSKLEEYLKKDLICHKCSKSMKNMPELKKHLETH